MKNYTWNGFKWTDDSLLSEVDNCIEVTLKWFNKGLQNSNDRMPSQLSFRTENIRAKLLTLNVPVPYQKGTHQCVEPQFHVLEPHFQRASHSRPVHLSRSSEASRYRFVVIKCKFLYCAKFQNATRLDTHRYGCCFEKFVAWLTGYGSGSDSHLRLKNGIDFR